MSWQVTLHETRVYVCLTRADGFSLTDGIDTLSVDGYYSNWDVVERLKDFRARELHPVDQYTATRCKRSIVPRLKGVQLRETSAVKTAACPYCHSLNCHRWKCVTTINKTLAYPIDAIDH